MIPGFPGEQNMEVFYRIVDLLGGLALFLYGMRTMGNGLSSVSGGAMRSALTRVTDKPIKGFLLGVLVTCMIQSSTATIVLTVGLVGAGFLTFRQSIGIVLGANVGTAITAQIIRLMDLNAGAGSLLYFFKSDNLAPLALVIGMVLLMFVGRKRSGAAGTILVGFGIVFVGLMNMSTVVSGMGDSLSHLLVSFEDNLPLGFLSGVLVTGVIQSSSAVIGILQTIASSVGVQFGAVFAVIIGVNIGDCLTTYLVCRIGAKPDQVRTCLVHIIYNVCAAVLLFVSIFILRKTGVLNDAFWNGTLRSGGVANVHGLFRLIPALLLLPFSGFFADLAEKIAKDEPVASEDAAIEQNLRELDERLLTTPAIALGQTESLLVHMAETGIHNFQASIEQFFAYDEKRGQRIAAREELLDRMADAANQYIIAVSPYIYQPADNRTQNYQIQALACFERIGDLAINITNNVENLRQAGSTLSEEAQNDLATAASAVDEILTMTKEALKESSTRLAKKIEPFEEVIDELIEYLRKRHTTRAIAGKCDAAGGIEYQNILLHMERISDQCSDLAVYLLGRYDESISGREHQYIHELHRDPGREYTAEFERIHERFFSKLSA